MIAEKSEAKVTGNLAGTTVKMSFDEESLVHLMGVMTDLYSDPEQAVIREYSTNALDAQIEAGYTGPIHVTLPSTMSPFFKVRDFGIGLSVEGLTEVYAKYGASTKRQTNAQTGMLGLGCKSALTYTTQFTLVSVKDGVKSQVAVGRNEEGAGSVTVVSVENTDEPSGTEVVVPCRARNDFAKKARKFFSYWEKGTVLIDGAEPKRIEGMDLKGDGSILVVDAPHSYGSEREPSLTVVMGGVPYPVPASMSEGLPINTYNKRVVARVPIGSVNFAPSREALMETDKTKATVAGVVDAIRSSLAAAIQRDVCAAANVRSALEVAIAGLASLARGTALPLTYKRRPIPTALRFAGCAGMVVQHTRKTKLDAPVGGLPLASLPGAVIVENHGLDNWTAGRRAKLDAWMSDHGGNGVAVILNGKLGPDERFWLMPDQIVQWETIKAITVNPAAKGGGRKRLLGSYTVWNFYPYGTGRSGGYLKREEVAADTLPEDVVVGKVSDDEQRKALVEYAVRQGHTVVRLEGNRIEKFERDFPKARTLDSVRDAVKAKFLAKLSDQQKIALAARQGDITRPVWLAEHKDKIADPEVVAVLDSLSLDVKSLSAEYSRIRQAGVWFSFGVDDPFDKYPLLDGYSAHRHAEHAVLYINAVHNS